MEDAGLVLPFLAFGDVSPEVTAHLLRTDEHERGAGEGDGRGSFSSAPLPEHPGGGRGLPHCGGTTSHGSTRRWNIRSQ